VDQQPVDSCYAPNGDVTPRFLQDHHSGEQGPDDGAERLYEDRAILQEGAPDETSAPFVNLRLRGVVLARNRTEPAVSATALENPDLQDLLAELPGGREEAILDFSNADVEILDADNHSGELSREAVEAIGGRIYPEPDAWWVTHRAGLKAVYVGEHAKVAALSAALSIPSTLGVEIKRDTRHPLALHNLAPEARCGGVHFADRPFRSERILDPGGGTANIETRDRWLREHDMEVGGRYDHAHCPIAPLDASESADAVVVYETGICCFRCRANGLRFKPGLPPGHTTFSELLGSTSCLAALVLNRVHWTHAEVDLTYAHPNLAPSVLYEIYRTALCDVYGRSDPRCRAIFSADLPWLRGEGCWLDKNSLTPVSKVDDDMAGSLPYCLDIEQKNNEFKIVINRARRHHLKYGRPEGYTPVRIVRPPLIEVPSDVITIHPPGPKYPVELLKNPMDETEAFKWVEQAFPGLDRNYLTGLICSVFCVQKTGGRPPMLCSTGSSGSGKGETVNLVGSFFAEIPPKINFKADDEAFTRSIGVALLGGSRLLVIDELGRENLRSESIGRLLRISGHVTWRPLYSSNNIVTPCRAVLVFPCASFPDHLKKSQEFSRRTLHLRLPRTVPDWLDTCGGETTAWRDRCEDNARAANSLLTCAFQRCVMRCFNLVKILDEIGFASLSDPDDAQIMAKAMVEIYQFCRAAGDSERFPKSDRIFDAGWINMAPQAVSELAFACVGLDTPDSLRDPRKLVQRELEARDWNQALGIDNPLIECKVRIHGSRWGIRFQSAGAPRGQELRNAQLPPPRIFAVEAGAGADIAPPASSASSDPAAVGTACSYLEEFLP
jgi:hypothetical protein